MDPAQVMSAPMAAAERPVMPAGLSRSWLLVAAREDRLASVTAASADEVVVDIEDAIDPSEKNAAREQAIEWIASGAGGWVRINSRGSDHWDADVTALRGTRNLRGVMLAKTERAGEVSDTVDRMGIATPVVALIESARGIEEAVAIAQAPGVARLAFGSGDYRRDTGVSADDLAMAYPRSRLVVASRIGGLAGPVDGPCVSEDHAAVRAHTAVGASLGMTGKLCLFPAQVPVVDVTLSPSREDVQWARTFLAEFDARGRTVRDGSDLPRLHHA